MGITYQPALQTVTATILGTASLSAAVDLMGGRLVGIQMPSAWTAAGLTFQASADGETYADLYDDGGNEVGGSAAASRYIVFDAGANFEGVRWLKVRSGTAASAVNQDATRTLTLAVKGQ